MSTSPEARTSERLLESLREFIRMESAAGLLLLLAAIFAMVLANSPIAHWYAALLDTPVAIKIGTFGIDKPLLLWINDGLMAVFFFLIGLELKREVLEGELSSFSQIVLPGMGAVGGMLVPAGVYLWMNQGDPAALNGWAIPVATDIAFALGLLSVFGKRVPTTLKIFLLTLAIFDDLAAIIIIALFYSGDLSSRALIFGAIVLGLAILFNRRGVMRISTYVFLGVVLWAAVLKSGVHATLAGVLIAFCVPMRDPAGGSPLRRLEHDLHGIVAFAILPIFAFANAGLSFTGMGVDDLFHPVTLGVIYGLVLGKPVGVMLFVGAAVATGFARLPAGVTWPQVLAVAFACGIGFTMSLFIAGLAFEHDASSYFAGDRLGILIGSIIAALIAYLLLHFSLPKVGQTPAANKS